MNYIDDINKQHSEKIKIIKYGAGKTTIQAIDNIFSNYKLRTDFLCQVLKWEYFQSSLGTQKHTDIKGGYYNKFSVLVNNIILTPEFCSSVSDWRDGINYITNYGVLNNLFSGALYSDYDFDTFCDEIFYGQPLSMYPKALAEYKRCKTLFSNFKILLKTHNDEKVSKILDNLRRFQDNEDIAEQFKELKELTNNDNFSLEFFDFFMGYHNEELFKIVDDWDFIDNTADYSSFFNFKPYDSFFPRGQ